jgi:hypothetical protein
MPARGCRKVLAEGELLTLRAIYRTLFLTTEILAEISQKEINQ